MDRQSDFDELDRDLTVERSGTWVKLTDRVRWLEGYRPWIIAVGVCGAMVGALSRVVPDPVAGTATAIVGALVAALSGIAVAAFDFKKLELGASLGKAESVAERAIAAGRAAEESLTVLREERRQLDRRRVHRLTALASMREMLVQLRRSQQSSDCNCYPARHRAVSDDQRSPSFVRACCRHPSCTWYGTFGSGGR